LVHGTQGTIGAKAHRLLETHGRVPACPMLGLNQRIWRSTTCLRCVFGGKTVSNMGPEERKHTVFWHKYFQWRSALKLNGWVGDKCDWPTCLGGDQWWEGVRSRRAEAGGWGT
jgi:hypothetical protein